MAKVEQNEKRAFTPITITLESQDEVNELFAIYNFRPIYRALGGGIKLDEKLSEYKDESYNKYHDLLDKFLKENLNEI